MESQQKVRPKVYRTDIDPFRELPVLEIKPEGRPSIRIFLDEDRKGAPVGLKIVGERPSTGQSLSRYISVKGTTMCDLDVKSIYGLEDIDEVQLIVLGAQRLAASLLSELKYEEAINVFEGIMIPASERAGELLGKPYVSYRIVADGIKDTARKRGRVIPYDIERVLNQEDLESAIREIDRLEPQSLQNLMLLCDLRTVDSIIGPEFMRMASYVMRKYGELMWTQTGGQIGIRPEDR